MNGRFARAAAGLPSIRAILQRAGDRVCERRSVVIVTPPSLATDELFNTLLDELWSRKLAISSITLEAGVGIADALRTRFPSITGTSRVDDLATVLEGATNEQVVAIRWIPPTDAEPAHTDLLAQWGKVQTRRPDIPVFCVLLSGAAGVAHLPPEDAHVNVFWAWDGQSALDVGWLCRTHADTLETPLLARWREHIAFAAAGTDFDCLDCIWDFLEAPLEELTRVLAQFGSDRGWSGLRLAKLQDSLPARHTTRSGLISNGIPITLRPAWADGMLQWSHEFGLEVHPAALAAAGLRHQLRHRIWRAQATLMLPLIDELRLAICQTMKLRTR